MDVSYCASVLFLCIWKINILGMRIAEFYSLGEGSPQCGQNEIPRFGKCKGQSLAHIYLDQQMLLGEGEAHYTKTMIPSRKVVPGGKAWKGKRR